MGPLIAESYKFGGRLMIDNHYSILKAIEAGYPKAAEPAIASHIGDAGMLILERLTPRHGA